MKNKKKVVVIGGGTGTYTVLTGLKKYSELDLSVIVSMMDDGGSNKVIRDQFGLLPTSDIRQCMVALASDEVDETIRKLFTYRYSQGTGIEGMTFGNLFMAALSDIYGSQKEAISKTSQLLSVSGNIIPITYDSVHLLARYKDGSEILGEHNIDEINTINSKNSITELTLVPRAKANPETIKSILEADLIILGPGDLYTSIICNLLFEDIQKAFKKTKAKVVYVLNIMTRDSQTHNFSATDHKEEIEKYLGRKITACIVNSGKLPSESLKWYRQWGMMPVVNDLKDEKDFKVIKANVISHLKFKKAESDKLTRSLIRHDSDKLAQVVVDMIKNS